MTIDIRAEISRGEYAYTDTERKIATFIMSKGKSIAGMNSAEVGEGAGVSQSAIIKFVKKLGFTGFTDFKVQLSESYGREEKVSALKHGDISLEDCLEDVSRAIVSESVSALSKSFEHMNFEEIEKCIGLIDASKRIYLCGKGSSALPAQDFASKLMKVGLTVLWYQDLEAMEAASFMAGEEDVFVSFSFSGETRSITRILKHAKERGAKVIVVTKNVEGSHGRLADAAIEIISNETIFRTAAMSSRIAFFMVVDILFLGIIKKNLPDRLKIIRDAYKEIGSNT